MTYKQLIIEKQENIAIVTINRHEKRNALGARTIEELGRAMDELDADPEVSAIVVAGAGGKAFSMGAELEGGFDLSGDVKEFVRAGQGVFKKIGRLGKPVVAAVEGYALGGGCELMLACDLSVVAENAAIGMPEVGLGLIPGWGGTQKIPRLTGKAAAMEILLLGGRIRAPRAKELGLINMVVPKEDVLKEAVELAKKLGRLPAHSVKLIKDAVVRGLETSIDEGLEIEAENFKTAFGLSGLGER